MPEWGVAEYFREKETTDLDTTGQGQEVIDFIEVNFHKIRSYKKILCKHDHIYNICTINKDSKPLLEILNPLLKKYTCAIKLNVSGGHIVLQDNDKLRYLTATIDSYLLLREAFEIKGPKDIDEFYKELLKQNVLDSEIFKLSNSKSRKILTTNLKIHVFCDQSRSQVNGGPPLDLGKWRGNQLVYCLQKNNNRMIFDNLCAFRAVTCFIKLVNEEVNFHPSRCPVAAVHTLYHEYRQAKDPQLPVHPIQYSGTYLPTLKSLCIFKKINVIIFSDETVSRDEANTYENPGLFDFQGGSHAPLSRIIYRYVGEFNKTMHLIDYQNHCMLIKPGAISSLLKQFGCRSCSYNTNRLDNLKRHEKTCSKEQKFTYRSGPFEVEKPLFIRSNQQCIPFPVGHEEFKYFIVWDLEASLKPTHITAAISRKGGDTPGTIYTAEHHLLSIALSTNFEHAEIEPVVCFVRESDSKEDEEKVMNLAVDYMLKVQSKVHEHLLSVFEGYLQILTQEIANEKQREDEIMSRIPGMLVQEEEVEEEEDDEAESTESRQVNKGVRLDKSPLVQLREDVGKWLEQLPILAFNGCRYDLNVVKEFLLPRLVRLHDAENVSILKRSNSYMCISTPKLRFLDITNYVGPSMNLEKMLISFKAPATKGHFPYEAVKSVSDLDRAYCPPIEAFDSVLRGTKLDQETYQEHVVGLWNEQGMRTWRDLLVFYNSNDVGPTLVAVQNYANEFPGTDLFKTFVSISGIAYYEMFRTAPPDVKFFRPGEELYKLMKKNLTGGFVSATTRHFKADATRLRNSESDLVGGVRQIQDVFSQTDGHLVGGVIGKGIQLSF